MFLYILIVKLPMPGYFQFHISHLCIRTLQLILFFISKILAVTLVDYYIKLINNWDNLLY